MVHNNVKEKRLQKGYTQEQLAQILNISNRTMQHIEAGTHNTNIEIVLKLKKVLNIEKIEDLFYIDN